MPPMAGDRAKPRAGRTHRPAAQAASCSKGAPGTGTWPWISMLNADGAPHSAKQGARGEAQESLQQN